jgi:signal transduction histidine kinase
MQIVEAHCGFIWVTSLIGIGSIFSVSLPLLTADNITEGLV